MVSPSITVGNSYCPENADFDNVFLVGYLSCILADSFQAIFRVRKTKTKALYFALPTEIKLSIAKRFAKSKFDMINNYSKNNEIKKTGMLHLIGELIQFKKQANENVSDLDTLRDIVVDNSGKTRPELQDLMMFNFRETVLSDCYYEAMLYNFLEICNYSLNDEDVEFTDGEQKDFDKYNNDSIYDHIFFKYIQYLMNPKLIF
jgi:hypothetical protein